MQLQKSTEEREGQVEELTQELKAARKEIGRLQPLEPRVRDLMSQLQHSQADKDRCRHSSLASGCALTCQCAEIISAWEML